MDTSNLVVLTIYPLDAVNGSIVRASHNGHFAITCGAAMNRSVKQISEYLHPDRGGLYSFYAVYWCGEEDFMHPFLFIPTPNLLAAEKIIYLLPPRNAQSWNKDMIDGVHNIITEMTVRPNYIQSDLHEPLNTIFHRYFKAAQFTFGQFAYEHVAAIPTSLLNEGW